MVPILFSKLSYLHDTSQFQFFSVNLKPFVNVLYNKVFVACLNPCFLVISEF